MSHRPAHPLRAAALAVLCLAACGAQAMTTSYQCNGRRVLTAELTPREGQLHFEGRDWTVRRVPSGRQARYLDRKNGVEIVIRERELTFTHGDETLQCFLFSDALPGDAPKLKPN